MASRNPTFRQYFKRVSYGYVNAHSTVAVVTQYIGSSRAGYSVQEAV